MLIYNCLNVLIVCISFLLRIFSVFFPYRFAYTLYFCLTNNMLIDMCLRSIFAYTFAFILRIFCVHISFHVNII